MDILPTETSSAKETLALGEQLANQLTAGDVLALYGDLGTGKTHLVKGIARGLGLPAREVNSPTFVIVREYESTPPLYHFDAYRVQHLDELYELGYEDYFYGDGICCVEWADRIEALIPDDALRIQLSHQGGDRRRIRVRKEETKSRRAEDQ